jgi:O-acetylserine/cysteine efflux transporter
MKSSHLAFIVLINFIWGFNMIAAKYGLGQFPPMLFTALRFGLLGLVLLPFLRWHPGQMGTMLLVSQTMGSLHFAAIFSGLALAEDVTAVAVATQLGVPFATVLSVLLLGEKVGWRRATGIVMAFGGVVLVSFDPAVLSYLDGLGLVTLGALFGAVGVIGMKRLRGVGSFEMLAWISVLSSPVLLAFSLITEHGQLLAMQTADWSGWLALGYTSLVASLVGHGGMYYLLQRYDVSLVTPFTLLATVFAMALGVLLLDNRLTAYMVAGGALTLAGVLIIAVRGRVKPLESLAAS